MKRKIQSNQKGFTLPETLIVIGILVCLMAVSIVGIITLVKHLQITECDNAARGIYMAAQNRATLLRSNQKLTDYVIHEGDGNKMTDVVISTDGESSYQGTVYYISKNDEHIDELLPKESIESDLWKGDFYIVYEPESGSVIDVFYAKEEIPISTISSFSTEGEQFRAFYDCYRNAPKKIRRELEPMIGYYGGDSAQTGNTLSLRTPVVNIKNENTLELEVTYWAPVILQSENVKLDVFLNYKEESLSLMEIKETPVESKDFVYTSYTYTWVLDSLEAEETTETVDPGSDSIKMRQFKDLFSKNENIYGEDFEISAEVRYSGTDRTVNGAKKTAKANSLFDHVEAKTESGSTVYTVYIANQRHLQNLYMEHSQVSEQYTQAVQIKDIEPARNDANEKYAIVPIENDALKLYDGDGYHICDMEIGTGTGQSYTGLFGSLEGSEGNHVTIRNTSLVNTVVKGTATATGVLLGSGECVNIEQCGVYWEERAGIDNDLGDSEKGINYKVSGTGYVGGLAGTLTNSTVENSFAATLIESNDEDTYIGGLIGSTDQTSITSSYADCYLKGKHSAGFIGHNTNNTSVVAGYAVGFIETPNGGDAAGICLKGSVPELTNVYSAMVYTVPTASVSIQNYPLCSSIGGDQYANTYYMESGLFGFKEEEKKHARSYKILTDETQWTDLFDDTKASFALYPTDHCHPYNLQTNLKLETYIYPGLPELSHYGDWGAQFQDGSLVYYEEYQAENGSTSYGFSGGGINQLKTPETIDKENSTIVKDGYAILFSNNTATDEIDLQFTYQSSNDVSVGTGEIHYSINNGNMKQISYVDGTTNQDISLSMCLLPDSLTNKEYASEQYYQKLSYQKTGNDAEKFFFYNPHFADTAVKANSAGDTAPSVEELSVRIRTPRHLYSLSKYNVYYASSNQYSFQQELDLDYLKYTGYDLFDEESVASQAPIGKNSQYPFRGSYDGQSREISGVKVDLNQCDQYIGLFGYNYGTSRVENVVYRMGENTTNTVQNQTRSNTLYIGGLFGYNSGIVENCAVSGMVITVGTYNYSTVYVGGFVGLNAGNISHSAAEAKNIETIAVYSHAYGAGFVGYNTRGGVIDQCYALGSVSMQRSQWGNVYACGFAGRNSHSISNSYAATELVVSGDAVSRGFCSDATTNCYYLNDGNFSYTRTYTAQYSDSSAEPKTLGDFTGNGDKSVAELTGMKQNVASVDYPDDSYPYPSAVTRNGSPVHYGDWPTEMNLGVVGMYYWEKMETEIEGSETPNISYHVSAITVDLDNQKVSKETTLSTEHADGGVITDFGYGYFYSGEQPTLKSTSIYWDDDLFSENIQSNQEVDGVLKNLIGGNYVFQSYNTWSADKQKGLHLVMAENRDNVQEEEHKIPMKNKDTPVGTWVLTKEDFDVKFQFTPFFADSLCYVSTSNGNSDVNMECLDSSVTERPGTDGNPYEVRSIEQLQFINWYACTGTNSSNEKYDGKTVNRVAKPGMAEGYMFLNNWKTWNGAEFGRQYVWEQTHDIDGKNIEKYTPIAAMYDNSGTVDESTFKAWFSGSYNGNDYVIKDVSIQTTDVNTVGLFGVTVNADLKNIILYSSDGNATISATTTNSGKIWYAIGGLVGLAANTEGSKREIQNCSVAGYTIYDNNKNINFGGGGVGGLVGICNMALRQCTAETDIVLNFQHSDPTRNVRVGGIAGSCQKSISHCYSGGSISLGEKFLNGTVTAIHVGGIVGGFFMKTVGFPNAPNGAEQITSGVEDDKAPSEKITDIQYCYTYLEIDSEVIEKSSTKYAIGGLGEIPRKEDMASHLADYTSCYYLSDNPRSDVLDAKASGVQNVTYENLSCASDNNPLNPDSEKKAAEVLMDNGFHSITTVSTTGAPLDGVFSYGISKNLLGSDYPFPTILTQSSSIVEDGKANVHYGDWPVLGIIREDGTAPISLDLFTKPSVSETLRLADGVDAGGEWSVSGNDFVTATVTEGKLEVTAKKAGNTTIEVVYTVNEKPYRLPIHVNITANILLKPNTESGSIIMFTNETATAPLRLVDGEGNNIVNATIKTATVEFEVGYLTEAKLQISEKEVVIEGTSATKVGNTQLIVTYTYVYNGEEHTDTSILPVLVVDPTITVKPLKVIFDSSGMEEKTEQLDGQMEMSVDVGDENPTTLNNILLLDAQLADEYYKDLVFIREVEEKFELVISRPANLLTIVPMVTEIQFEYGGSRHTMKQSMNIEIINTADPLPAITVAFEPETEEQKAITLQDIQPLINGVALEEGISNMSINGEGSSNIIQWNENTKELSISKPNESMNIDLKLNIEFQYNGNTYRNISVIQPIQVVVNEGESGR